MATSLNWYHCSVKLISRSSGRTAVAAAAYRSGERLHDAQLEKTYDYTRKRGIETAFIVAPENAPQWAYNLESLWNEAQAKDTRKNSCLARECELALPGSLDATDREALAREFATHLVERYGVAVSLALHEPSGKGDDRNYHAHILMTTRRMDANGFGQKTRELDDRKTGSQEIIHIREFASAIINDYLEVAGLDERVDHRSFEELGITREPTKHRGVEASAMEQRGEVSELGSINREIVAANDKLDTLTNELATIDAQIAAEMEAEFLPDPEPQELAHTWEEQKAAVDIFKSPIAEAYENDILESGQVQEHGLGRGWFDRTVTLFENLYYGTLEAVRTAFERIVGGGEATAQDPELDADDYEPDR